MPFYNSKKADTQADDKSRTGKGKGKVLLELEVVVEEPQKPASWDTPVTLSEIQLKRRLYSS